MPSSLLDVCRFNPTLGGTTDWTYSSAVTGYQSPATAGAVNGAVYSYRAESNDLSQWEVGFGAYNSGTGVFARTTVLFNSSGGTSKINFTTVPQVAIVALAEDLAAGAWTSFTPTFSSDSGAFTTISGTLFYKQIGKIVYINFFVSVTTVGTGGTIRFTLPVTPRTSPSSQNTCGIAQEGSLTGKAVISPLTTGVDNLVRLYYYDHTQVAANGAQITGSLVYEAA